MSSGQLKHLVFAYGTLKQGEPNFKWLTEEAEGNFKVLAVGKTSKKRALVIGSRYNVPYLLDYSGIFILFDKDAITQRLLYTSRNIR